jgi:hypothetical protein
MQKCLHSNWLQNNEAFSKAPKQQQKVIERWKNRKKEIHKNKSKNHKIDTTTVIARLCNNKEGKKKETIKKKRYGEKLTM